MKPPSANATAARDLREAISAYRSYRYSVENGRMLVNADDDPTDIVEAARRNVEHCLHACQALGFTDVQLEQILSDGGTER